MPSFKLIPVGSVFGRLSVIGGPVREDGRMIRYPCQCVCGQQTLSVGAQLRNKTAQSCGCARKEAMAKLKTTHGESSSPLYIVWSGMKARCSNKSHISYRYYGAKGIRVGREFQDYARFSKWAKSSGYRAGLTIERKNTSLGYTPENCCWVNWKTQNRNSRSVHKVQFQGRTLCLEQWAEVTGIRAATIRRRLKNGFPIWRALTKGRK